jgi:hypothetical protein
MRRVRGFANECVEGFVGEGGVFGVAEGTRVWPGVEEDDSDVDDDIEDDDDREELLEVSESSEPDDALRPLCGKYLGFAKEPNGEGDRDPGGR